MLLCLAVASVAARPATAGSVVDGQRTYAIDFVSTAARGVAMNDAGDVTGTSYPDPGCGAQCLPPLDTVVWRGGARIVLPDVPGFSDITVSSINAQGWVAGFAGFPFTLTHAAVWKPDGDGYAALDLGVLPGTNISYAVGIDDLGRVVGWSTTSNFPPQGSPFLWSEETGMVDLAALGFPDEQPLAISPGGAVATASTWYRLGDPNSVILMPPAPDGFLLGGEPTAINDVGDQARFLVSTGPENLRYLFRFHHEERWQQISPTGTGHLAVYGVGSINAARDLSATVVSTGVVARGPDGLAQPLADLLSPAYQGGDITVGGPMNSAGQVLSQVIVGRSPRLVRLTPARGCDTNCTRVAMLEMRGQGPGFCDEGQDHAAARLTVVDEAGNPLSGVRITGHFLDDYWLDQRVEGQTNAQGRATFRHDGPPCVGAIAFLVTGASKAGRAFDRTTGTLANDVIPLP
jgi:probable HAF family extracellular repeat protein